MKTQYYTAATLDGFVATEDHSLEWLFQLGDPTESTYAQFIEKVGAIAMGAGTYEWLLRDGLRLDSEDPVPWPNEQPTWVFSHRTHRPVPGADLRFVQGDVRPVHAAMRAAAGDRNIWLAGGGDLVGQFHDAGLLDEIIVQIGSVLLATGRPFLPRRIAFPPLRLTSARQIGAEMVELRYDVPKPDEGERKGAT